MLSQILKRRFSTVSPLTKKHMDLEFKYVAQCNYVPAPIIIERGEGIYLWDVDGNRYMDMLAGFASVS